MKLKQRVILTATLLLGMSVFFLVGVLFAPSRGNSATAGKNAPEVAGPVFGEKPDYDQEEGLERNRRLQQKVDDRNRDELEKQPRGPDSKELPVQWSPKEGHDISDPQFELPAEIVEEEGGLGDKEVGEKRVRVGEEERDPWKVWQSWVRQDHFYPEDAFWSEDMNSILNAMATYPITSFDVGHRGTQLKVSMLLGEQRTAFKPMR